MSILELFRLDGRVAVVTGSGRGIGRATALALADAGADVVVTARRAHEVAAVAEEVRARGRRALEVPGDLRGDTPERLAAAAAAELGRLDVWVNNAGGTDDPSVRPLAATSDQQLRDMLELNLVALLACVRAAAGRLPRGGAIVNIASGAGMRAAPGTGAYGAAKAAVLNLTATLAAELAPAGVRVNAVSPGMVPTETFFEALRLTEDDLPRLTATVPLGRMGTPEDMAAAVLYLASPAASWVTGQNLLVGGGRDGGRTVEDRYTAQ
ncbi:SDR family NAD(P)-dependent oxidoreductase [Trujillonella humicola]|uniref:SDR family NAD(P)-dependent oxidoreductase n=1 Tax=Trujillonella humicola TaxID=3383699 RepID=UPI003906B33A